MYNNILITGASKGIGEYLARYYASKGVTLFLCARNMHDLEQVKIECDKLDATTYIKSIDVADKESLNKWINTILESHEIDLVIANAGIGISSGPEGEVEDQCRKIFDINLYGVLNTLLPIIPYFKERKHGQIAIISSLAAFRGLPSCPSYSASKAAVKAYGEAMRGELYEHNVGVTVICPGYIKTAMTDSNKFPMPFLMDVDKAAKIIAKRLERNPSRIAFPFIMYFSVWLISIFPPSITDILFRNLPKK